MNLKPLMLLIATLLFVTVACNKNTDDIPNPVAPPPVEVEEKAEPVVEPPKPVVEETPEPEVVEKFDPSKYNITDVYFDFDKSDLRDDTLEALRAHAEVLKANRDIKVLIEGHCDERGTEEYNMALGERRAERVREYFISSGISASRLNTISYGELRPKMDGSNEDAWAKNRRAHFKLSKD